MVESDEQAFLNVKNRLTDDVGGFLQIIKIDKSFTPFWAIARMLFPVAESIGDLIHHNVVTTTKNLEQILQIEFEAVRQGYNNKANLIAQLYRHSLIHTDELRELDNNSLICTWSLSLDRSSVHLATEQLDKRIIRINFDLLHFYDDMVKVLDYAIVNAKNNIWNGKIKNHYNSWTLLDISTDAKYQKARDELNKLIMS